MKTVLIVDDQLEVREVVQRTLRSGDYRVLQAESGEKAVEIAKAERPELIIMDIIMEGNLDGLEATRTIKADPETEECRVIILTAKDEERDRQMGLGAGADDYFAKPFSPLELIKKVEASLE